MKELKRDKGYKRRGEQKKKTGVKSNHWENNQSRKTQPMWHEKTKIKQIPADWILVLLSICFRSPAAGRRTLGQAHYPYWTYTHVCNHGRVGLMPEHNLNQLFCSLILNSFNQKRHREREKTPVFSMLRNIWPWLSWCDICQYLTPWPSVTSFDLYF